MSKIKPMTEGPILRPIIAFTIPILLSSLLQTLYNAVDSVIVGRFAENGEYALGAVGSTGAIHSLFIGFFIGISSGAGVVVSQYFGSRDEKGVFDSVHTSMLLSFIIGTFLTVFGVLLSPMLVRVTNTPPEIENLAIIYLRILFCGMIPSIVYNFGAGILRSIGDSKRPLIYLIISSLINVVFNCIFVIIFHMSVDGVAYSTVISQVVCAVLVVIRLMKTNECYKLYLKKLCIRKKQFIEIIQIGIPAGLQSVIFNISNVVIQAQINSFGATVVAARSAQSKIETMLYSVANSIGVSATTFSGQNKGARKFDRIVKGTFICMATSIIVVFSISVLSIIFSRQLIGLFNDSPDVIASGSELLTAMVAGYFLLGIVEVLSGSIRGSGKPIFPMISTIIGIFGGRLLWIYLINIFLPPNPILVILSYPVSWFIIAVAQLIYFTKYRSRWLYS